MSNDMLIMNSLLKIMWKEMTVICFIILPSICPEGSQLRKHGSESNLHLNLRRKVLS